MSSNMLVVMPPRAVALVFLLEVSTISLSAHNRELELVRKDMSFFGRIRFDWLLGEELHSKPQPWLREHVSKATVVALKRFYKVVEEA